MADCECLPKCPFFHDRMDDVPAIAEMIKQRLCKGDNSRCARHMVFERLGSAAVPTDLYPSEIDRARQLLARH